MSSTPTTEQLLARIAELEAQAKQPKTGWIKVSTKGAVSVYGLGRFPVTLYATQWESLMEKLPDVKAFIDSNRASLASKPE